MNARAWIEAGILGFVTQAVAASKDDRAVTSRIVTCGIVTCGKRSLDLPAS